MSYTSNYNLNQRVSYLESVIQGLIPYLPPTLANILIAGNNAGANDIDLNNNQLLNCAEITASGDLILNPVGSIDCNGKTINMTGGEIHNCPLIHSQNNQNIIIEGKGTGDVILETNGVDRVTISDTGAITFQGGMSYNNVTNTLTATTFDGDATRSTTSLVANSNTNGTFFPIFTSGVGNRSLFIDNSSGPFSINPNTGNLSFATTIKIEGTENANAKLAIGLASGQTSQGDQCVAIGRNSGNSTQGAGAVAVGNNSGLSAQGATSVAVGPNAGQNNQGTGSVAIGNITASTSQGGSSVAIGNQAARHGQGTNSIAIGVTSASGNIVSGTPVASTIQGNNAVAIGNSAGRYGQSAGAIAIGIGAGAGVLDGAGAILTQQQTNTIAIGNNAGTLGQKINSIAIGNLACSGINQDANSIVINASGVATNTNGNDRCFIRPIRGVALGIGVNRLSYDPTTFEITYSTT